MRFNENTTNKIEYFYIKKPTFYQLKSFIAILADQFRYFTRNFYLEKSNLFDNASNLNKPYLKEIRQFIINSIIKITKFFTEGAYDSLMQSQNVAYKSIQPNYDQDDAEKQAIHKLTERKVVSFSQIKPSLLFFNEDGYSFSIISICLKLSESNCTDCTCT